MTCYLNQCTTCYLVVVFFVERFIVCCTYFVLHAPQDDEELQWLAVAKQGKGVLKSEKRQENAETEYHRLLCEESMQQVRKTSVDAATYNTISYDTDMPSLHINTAYIYIYYIPGTWDWYNTLPYGNFYFSRKIR